MKTDKLKDMNRDELQKELQELKAELFKLRFQFATSQLDNPMLMKGVKKDIARVKTFLRELDLKQNAN